MSSGAIRQGRGRGRLACFWRKHWAAGVTWHCPPSGYALEAGTWGVCTAVLSVCHARGRFSGYGESQREVQVQPTGAWDKLPARREGTAPQGRGDRCGSCPHTQLTVSVPASVEKDPCRWPLSSAGTLHPSVRMLFSISLPPSLVSFLEFT